MSTYSWSVVPPLQYSSVPTLSVNNLYKTLPFVHAIYCEFLILAQELDPDMMVSFLMQQQQIGLQATENTTCKVNIERSCPSKLPVLFPLL